MRGRNWNGGVVLRSPREGERKAFFAQSVTTALFDLHAVPIHGLLSIISITGTPPSTVRDRLAAATGFGLVRYRYRYHHRLHLSVSLNAVSALFGSFRFISCRALSSYVSSSFRLRCLLPLDPGTSIEIVCSLTHGMCVMI